MADIPCYVSLALRQKAREEEEWLAKRPKCSDCGEPIQDEYCYLINDELICPECLKYNYRKNTEDFEVVEDYEY